MRLEYYLVWILEISIKRKNQSYHIHCVYFHYPTLFYIDIITLGHRIANWKYLHIFRDFYFLGKELLIVHKFENVVSAVSES